MQHKQRVGADPTVTGDNSKSSVSMGGIDLCFSDWLRIAKPRMQQYVAGLTVCDVCGSDSEPTLRLTLKQSKREGEKVHDKGRGSIVLCHTDWERIGLPTMRHKPDRQTDPARLFGLNALRARKD